MQEGEQLVEKRPENRMRKLKLVAGSLALSLLPIGAGTGIYINGDPLFLPKTGISFLTENSCPPTPVDEIIKVDRLVNSTGREFSFANYGQQLAFAREQAEINGLTLVDPSPFEGKLNEAKNIDEALEVLNEYSRNFGFEFEFPTETKFIGLSDFSYSVANKEEITLEVFKTNTYGFLDVFAFIPTEFGRLSGVKKVNFVNIPETEDAGGGYSPIDGDAYLAYNKLHIYQFSDVRHELYHGVDTHTCGTWGSDRDGEFANLNQLGNNSFNYGSIDTSQRFVIREYGSKNMKEDKATILEYVIPGFAQYEKYGPVLQEKIVLLLARLESKIPGITSYLKAISARGQI